MSRTQHRGARRLAMMALVLGLAGLLASAPAALAHVALISSDPADGAELARAPGQVSLVFNEPVGLPPEPVRVYDATGRRVDAGEAGHGPSRSVVRVGLRPGLTVSVYTVTWRVLSEDTHPVSGSVSFTVGDPSDVRLVLPPEAADAGSQETWDIVAAVVRWPTDLGTLLTAGVVLFLLLVHDRNVAERRPLVRVLRIAATVAVGPRACRGDRRVRGGFWGVDKIPGEPWIYGSDRNGGLYIFKEKGTGPRYELKRLRHASATEMTSAQATTQNHACGAHFRRSTPTFGD